jgi:hypothetical protein
MLGPNASAQPLADPARLLACSRAGDGDRRGAVRQAGRARDRDHGAMTNPGAPPDRSGPRPPDHELRVEMMQKPLFGPKSQPAAVPGTSVTVDGEVVRVTFENDETGFRVLRVSVEGRLQPETWVGVLPVTAPGTRVRATGRYERYGRHGDQLKVETLLTVAPSTMDGIERYLGSGMVPGIGPAFAWRSRARFRPMSLRWLRARCARRLLMQAPRPLPQLRLAPDVQ